MTALEPTAWFHYFSEDQLVLVSPALANLDAQDRDVYSASALVRPALGLLPPHVRYILARDGTLRLEFVDEDAAGARKVFEAEQEDWKSQRLSGEDLDDLLREMDEDSGPIAFELESEWDAIAAVSSIVAVTPKLPGSFVADSLAPWGVFCLEDEEIITAEALAGGSLLRFDRSLYLPTSEDDMPLQLVEWLLRINTASVIGPRCTIQLETDTGLPLLGLSLMPGSIDGPMLLSALSELHTRACGIEQQWLLMAGQVGDVSELKPNADWLRA
jgi:hypothetical protein